MRLKSTAASTGPRDRTSRRTEPVPGSESLSVSRPLPPRMARTRARKCRMFVEIARRVVGRYGLPVLEREAHETSESWRGNNLTDSAATTTSTLDVEREPFASGVQVLAERDSKYVFDGDATPLAIPLHLKQFRPCRQWLTAKELRPRLVHPF